MIIDSFMFFNEFDILEGRLEYLYDHVDYFVLVESNLTHGGQPKPMHYMENMSRYKKYLDKIIYMPYAASVDQFEYNKMPKHDRDFETGPWQMENAQRNHIAKALEFYPDDALLLISDVDEIPHKDCMAIAENSFKNFGPLLAIQQTYYCYNFNQKYKNPWHGTVATNCGYAKANTPQFCRNHKYNIPVISQGGWHLTYWGTPEHIASKVKSFAHQELNTERFTDPEYIKQQVAAGKDLFSRDWNEFVPEDPNNIPPEIKQIFGHLHEKLSSVAK